MQQLLNYIDVTHEGRRWLMVEPGTYILSIIFDTSWHRYNDCCWLPVEPFEFGYFCSLGANFLKYRPPHRRMRSPRALPCWCCCCSCSSSIGCRCRCLPAGCPRSMTYSSARSVSSGCVTRARCHASTASVCRVSPRTWRPPTTPPPTPSPVRCVDGRLTSRPAAWPRSLTTTRSSVWATRWTQAGCRRRHRREAGGSRQPHPCHRDACLSQPRPYPPHRPHSHHRAPTRPLCYSRPLPYPPRQPHSHHRAPTRPLCHSRPLPYPPRRPHSHHRAPTRPRHSRPLPYPPRRPHSHHRALPALSRPPSPSSPAPTPCSRSVVTAPASSTSRVRSASRLCQPVASPSRTRAAAASSSSTLTPASAPCSRVAVPAASEASPPPTAASSSPPGGAAPSPSSSPSTADWGASSARRLRRWDATVWKLLSELHCDLNRSILLKAPTGMLSAILIMHATCVLNGHFDDRNKLQHFEPKL